MTGSKKVAYMIMAHRDAEHLKDLINALDYLSDFYIYIDKKSDIKAFQQLVGDHPNVFFMGKRKNIMWGGYSQVQPVLDMLRAATQKGSYARYVFLTGADYPVFSAKKTYEKLIEEPEREYICSVNLKTFQSDRFLQKIKKRWFFDINVNGSFFERALRKSIDILLKALPDKKATYSGKNKKYDIYYGFAYWGITDACARNIVNTIRNEKGLVGYLRHSYAPIEILVQTIVFNSGFAKHAFEYKTLNGWDIMAFAPLHFVKYSGTGSKVLDENDYNEIIESDKLFIMKTDSIRSKKLIAMINGGN